MVAEVSFSLSLLSRFTEFGAGVEDAVSNHTEMGHDVSLHAKEVQDEEEEALLHIQAHIRLVPSSLTQCQLLTFLSRAPMPEDPLCAQKSLPIPSFP